MKILTLKEACNRLGVSLSTLKRMIADDVLVKVQITDRRVGIVDTDIDGLIARLRDAA